MRIFLVIAITTLAIFPGTAQTYKVFKGDTINRIDAKGQKQGLWRKYYDTDTLFSEGTFKNSHHSGTFRTFYKNGKPQSILKFRGNSEISDAELFNEKGGILAHGKYIDHLKDSLWIYFDESKNKNAEEFYIKGKKEGVWKLFYQNGKISREVIYKDDKLNGDYKEFFESGSPKIQGRMVNDSFDGLVKVFHPNGKIWQEGSYKNGLKVAVWKIYKEDGTVEKEEVYKSGSLQNPISEGD